MAEKVPSFKTGGTLWFTDLTTADTTYILSLLTAITFIWWSRTCRKVWKGIDPVAGTMKKFSRIIAFLSIPILMGIEKAMIFFGHALFCYWLTSNLFTLGYGLGKSPPLSLSHRLLNLPDAVTSSSTGQPKPPSPIPFSFEQPKDQSVIGHEDPPMVNKEASGPQASRVENEEVNSVISDIPRDGPRRPTKNAVRDWAAIFRTASRVGQARRVPPEDKPAAVRDGTGRENPIDIS
ncbi:unnamed protein product, partial [Brassica oleracea var. botrytis]